MDVVSKTFTRVAQEILLKQDRTSATLVMSSLAGATIKSSPLDGDVQVFRTVTADTVLIDDFNKLMTLAKRVNTSWIGGTPATRTRGITDIVCSPEVVGSIRAMAYNPVNTTAVPDTSESTVLPAPEQLRNELYQNAGLDSFMGVNILEFNEFGKGQKFNTLFDNAAGTTSYKTFAGARANQFAGASDEIIVGVDRTRDSLMRVVATDPDSQSEMNLVADDQYSIRQNKIGYFGQIEDGRIVLDNRVLLGLIKGQ